MVLSLINTLVIKSTFGFWEYLYFTGKTAAQSKLYVSCSVCPTLCDPVEGSPPGSSVHGIFQARILEWDDISYRGSSQPRDWTHISCISCTGRQSLHHCATWEALGLWLLRFSILILAYDGDDKNDADNDIH